MATEESMVVNSYATPTPNDDDGIYHLDGDDELDIMATTPHLLISDSDEDDVSRGLSLLSLNSAPDAADEEEDDNDEGEDDDDEGEDDDDEGEDEDDEDEDDDDEGEDANDDNVDGSVRRFSRSMWIRREHDRATDSRRANRRRKATSCRERFLSRAWEMRSCSSGDSRRHGFASPEGDMERLECRLMVRPHGREEGIPMDMEEVKACRDLGLPLPRDWTVEISGAGDTSSGGSSPMSDWCISSPGDSPKDIKARLKVWAQAVALASTSRLSN